MRNPLITQDLIDLARKHPGYMRDLYKMAKIYASCRMYSGQVSKEPTYFCFLHEAPMIEEHEKHDASLFYRKFMKFPKNNFTLFVYKLAEFTGFTTKTICYALFRYLEENGKVTRDVFVQMIIDLVETEGVLNKKTREAKNGN